MPAPALCWTSSDSTSHLCRGGSPAWKIWRIASLGSRLWTWHSCCTLSSVAGISHLPDSGCTYEQGSEWSSSCRWSHLSLPFQRNEHPFCRRHRHHSFQSRQMRCSRLSVSCRQAKCWVGRHPWSAYDYFCLSVWSRKRFRSQTGHGLARITLHSRACFCIGHDRMLVESAWARSIQTCPEP